MKNLLLVTVLAITPIAANADTQIAKLSDIQSSAPLHFQSGELLASIPQIINSIPGLQHASVAGTPLINVNGKHINSYSQDTLNTISSDSIQRFEYLPSNIEHPNGVLLLYVNGI